MELKYPDFFTENFKKDLEFKTLESLLPDLPNLMNEKLIGNVNSPINLQRTNINEITIEYLKSIALGRDHLKTIEYLKKYGTEGLSSNLHLPIVEMDEDKNIILRDLFIINHPEDAMRIANKNIKKMRNFKPIVLDSIISTTDNNHWKKQRNLLIGAFLPHPILQKLFKKSNRLAKDMISKLEKRIANTNHSIDMNEFLLEQTQEQLQRVILGMDKSFVLDTNKKIRNAFNGIGPKGYVRDFVFKVIEKLKTNIYNEENGPISKLLKDYDLDNVPTELYGNIVLLAFAGHDTTGHTLTWLLFELSRNKDKLIKLQKEIDHFWEKNGNNLDDIKYKHLIELPYLTRCIHETLRLWPAVSNGTFRELREDTYIHGLNNELVKLPKGTYTKIPNYIRHRNPKLWGKDAELFNPDREWYENEIWGEKGFSASNISSKRYSPFSFSPRDCLGKNFAQMEMRLILLHLLRNYEFITDNGLDKEFIQTGFNRATLAPINIYADHNYPNTLLPILETGCWFYVDKRNIISRL